MIQLKALLKSKLLEVAVIGGLATAPFWVFAKTIRDGDEAYKSLIGGGLVTVSTLFLRWATKRMDGVNPKPPTNGTAGDVE